MNISLKKASDNATAIVKMEFKEEDYYPEVEKYLRSVRQQTEMDGFRKGKVPYEIIRGKYEIPAIINMVQRLVDEKLPAYLEENNISIIGMPIPNDMEQKEIDWKNEREFELCFDVALRPEVSVSISKEDVLTRYKVPVTDEIVEREIKSGTERFGTSEVSEVLGEKSFLKADLTELTENDVEKENGLKVEDSMLYPMYFRSQEQKDKFKDAKVGDEIIFNLYEAVGGAEVEISQILEVDRLDVPKYKGNFKLKIKEIRSFVPAEVNKAFFSRMLEGRTDVEDEATFKEELKKVLSKRYEDDAEKLLAGQVRKLILDKVGELPLSVDFFKRLAMANNDKVTEEQVNQHIPEQMDTIKWSIIKEHIRKENDIRIDDKDILEEAKKRIEYFFKLYGMPAPSDEDLEKRAMELLKGGEHTNELENDVIDKWIAKWAIDQVTIKDEDVTPEKFLEEFLKIGNLAH